MKKVILFIILISSAVFSQPKFSEISAAAGSFSRMGFGARGIGMGNAMSAVTEGNLVSYYNPALGAFQDGNFFQASYSFLSLDRALNFVNFTRRFDFTRSDSSIASAGISAGLINSGVSKIDGRDNQGFKTEELSTSENQFFVGLSNRFSEKVAIGIAVKFYYYKLYKEISSTGFGLDIGLLYKINDEFNLSLMIADLNSKYRWDTSPIYNTDGSTSDDKFPLTKKIAISYFNSDIGLLASLEFENSNAETNILRFGAEYNIFDKLFVRAGLDQINLSNFDFLPKPAFGFSYSKYFGEMVIGIDYAFMIEQYSPQDRHIVGVNVVF